MLRLIILGFFLFSNFSDVNALIHYYAEAIELGTNNLVYTDEYKESFDEKGLLKSDIIYRSPRGDIVATKELRYGRQHTAPSFRLDNSLTGGYEGVTVSRNTMTIFYKYNPETELKTNTIDIPKNAVIDGGFHYFVMKHWNKLIKNEVVQLAFVVPSRLSYVGFQVREVAREEWSGHDSVVFRIEPSFFLFQWLVDPIILRYDFYSKDLLTYTGISNIHFKDGPKKVSLTLKHRTK